MKLVYTPSNHCDAIPFTTPEIIAKVLQCDSSIIKDYIKQNLHDFRKLTSFPKSIYCDVMEENHLNEAQAILLVSRMNKSKTVKALRDELIRQFDAATDELDERKDRREQFRAARQVRTNLMRRLGIKASLHGRYAELAYNFVYGESASIVRYRNGVPAYAQTVDFLTAAEMVELTKAQAVICEHLRAGHDYNYIKAWIKKQRATAESASTDEDVPDLVEDPMFWKYVAEKLRPYFFDISA